jgi:hypothetical protein
MTFQSFRSVLAVAWLLAAVGLGEACTPPPPQATWVQPPSGYPTPAPIPTPVQSPYSYVAQATPPLPANASWFLSVVNGKLQLQTADGSRSMCERLTIMVSGVDPVEVTVVGKQIQIAAGKDCKGGTLLQGTAERLTRTGVEGALLTLEGSAKLVYVRNGHKAEISADRISVHLAAGQIVTDMDVPKPVTPVLPPGTGYPVTPAYSPSLPPAPSLGAHY